MPTFPISGVYQICFIVVYKVGTFLQACRQHPTSVALLARIIDGMWLQVHLLIKHADTGRWRGQLLSFKQKRMRLPSRGMIIFTMGNTQPP